MGGFVKFCSGHKSHRRGSSHSCVGCLLLGHGLSGSGKLLNHTSLEVGKSCLSSPTVVQRGNVVVNFSATGKGVRCFPRRPAACAALCQWLPSPCPARSREAAVLRRQCRDSHRSHLRLSPRSRGTWRPRSLPESGVTPKHSGCFLHR